MTNLIKKIINGDCLGEVISYIFDELYIYGPSSLSLLEIITYLKIYQAEYFSKYEGDILELMGIFYKNNKVTHFKSLIMKDYNDSINSFFHNRLTPIQADMYNNILFKKNYSFSAATSTGKSFVFMDIISKSRNQDVVIIVPSRALINEYLIKLKEIIKDKNVNILPFVDNINIKRAKRNIFVLTPERAKELFKYKSIFDIQLFLFDEAQLGDEENSRGIIFDSIVRRIDKDFPKSKKLFAHPFISNPEAQLTKNNLSSNSGHNSYLERSVGQIFICYNSEENSFSHFGIDKEIMGNRKEEMTYDPVEKVLKNNGSILIYCSKSSIISGDFEKKFEHYINLCEEIIDQKALDLIISLKKLLGASDNAKKVSYSKMIVLLKKGIILHHGSLPLDARIIVEEFTRLGYCRLCFATSTLVQGINMPFDIVWLNLFQESHPLSVKNLIGRAGRSTSKNKFDYGIVIVKESNVSSFRKILNNNISIRAESLLDNPNLLPEEFIELRDAINNNEMNDEYNLSEQELHRLTTTEIFSLAKEIIDILFVDDRILTGEEFSNSDKKQTVYRNFQLIFQSYLKGRELSIGEKSVISTAIMILIWQIQGKTFKQIVGYRFAYIRKQSELRKLEKEIENTEILEEKKLLMDKYYLLEPRFTMPCSDIPNKNLCSFSLFSDCKAYKVDYDRVVYDTYDYMDKIIGFKLQDIYYSVFDNYYKKYNDERFKKFCFYLKYGTINEKEILMLRYGFSFDTIEWLKDYIEKIDEEEIIFSNINNLDQNQLKEIDRYLP